MLKEETDIDFTKGPGLFRGAEKIQSIAVAQRATSFRKSHRINPWETNGHAVYHTHLQTLKWFDLYLTPILAGEDVITFKTSYDYGTINQLKSQRDGAHFVQAFSNAVKLVR